MWNPKRAVRKWGNWGNLRWNKSFKLHAKNKLIDKSVAKTYSIRYLLIFRVVSTGTLAVKGVFGDIYSHYSHPHGTWLTVCACKAFLESMFILCRLFHILYLLVMIFLSRHEAISRSSHQGICSWTCYESHSFLDAYRYILIMRILNFFEFNLIFNLIISNE